MSFLLFFGGGGNWPLKVKFFKFLFQKFSPRHRWTLCSNFVKFGRREIDEIVRLFTRQKISPVSQTVAPKICQSQPPTVYVHYVVNNQQPIAAQYFRLSADPLDIDKNACWCGLASDILKKNRLNCKLKIINTADNAGITQSQARDTELDQLLLNCISITKCKLLFLKYFKYYYHLLWLWRAECKIQNTLYKVIQIQVTFNRLDSCYFATHRSQ